MGKQVWGVNWDNGFDACGTFPWTFDTEEEATRSADQTVEENLLTGVWLAEDEPHCEAILLREDPTDEEIDAAVESSGEYFDHYIAGDR